YEGASRAGPSRFPLEPNVKVLRHLAFCCRERSNLLDGFEASRYADALLALSAHGGDWLRPLDAWEPPPGEPRAQFASLARHLLATRIGTSFHANDFWETVIRWLIDHPEVEPVHHGPIVDYLHDQKFVPSIPLGPVRGQPRLVPARPNLCMKGRSPDSLLRD